MKTLALFRHAKSSWDDPQLADFDRPLNGRGRKAAFRMGREMRQRRLHFDLVIASSAMRVRETLVHAQEGYGSPFEVQYEPRMYGASSGVIFEIMQAADDSVGRMLLVGHNPGLQEFAGAITAGDDPLHSQVAGHFPTAALLIIELPARSWRDVEPGSGRISNYLKPRELES